MLDATASTTENPPPPTLAPWFLFARGVGPKPDRVPTGPDEALWRLVAGGRGDWRQALPHPAPAGEAPLHPHAPDTAIEVWTERDLSAIHAASRLLARSPDEALHARVESAVAWHLAYTEPDNATGRPWAAHVFAARSIVLRDAGARLYAEHLLHACQVLEARPDALSAEILRDAAETLRAASAARA
ncbi:MAG: hypothetical protein D6693_07825 [Planctomycetota bacterium]|nr:MAG: hypothetical protein D6693_07825 [Planctomycetota bacterium]